MPTETITTLANDLLGAAEREVTQSIAKQSPSGFSLRRFVQTATPKNGEAVRTAVCSVWMATCGCEALKVGDAVLDSPIQGLSKFLLGNPDLYSAIETLFIEMVTSWNPEAVHAAKVPLGKDKKLFRITRHDGPPLLAVKVTPGKEGVVLETVTVETDGRLLRSPAGISPEHPFSMFLSGFRRTGNVTIEAKTLDEISDADSPSLRFEVDDKFREELVKLTQFSIESEDL